MHAKRENYEDQSARAWLEWASGVQRRAMYDRASRFTRAAKESDHDVAAFGQSVKTVELNRAGNGLLYRCWHLRDVAWAENAEGEIDTVHRKWRPSVAALVQTYGERVHSKVTDRMVGPNKAPHAEIDCRHIVMPAELYDGAFPGKGQVPWVEIVIDVENRHLIEVTGLATRKYIIPRWQTVSGSPYSFSPATVCALPDARLLQAMTRCLLEAGEKFTNPPMLAVQEAIRSDISIYAGGITWVDAEYDERLGEVLRPLSQDRGGMPIGFEMRGDVMRMIQEAFFISKLTLPQRGPEMTAYEVGQRVQDYIRQAAPLFEPLEDEDNAATCEATFELLLRHGAFGPPDSMPQSLRGADIEFRFQSPLHDAIERQKGQKFIEARTLLAETAQLDPSVAGQIDVATAMRDVLGAIGVPALWLRSEEEAAELAQAQQQEAETAKLLEGLGAGAETAKAMGEAGDALLGAVPEELVP
jgi:hypothetical protein